LALARRIIVAKYLVERYLPGIQPDQLAAAAGSAKSTSEEMTREGMPVRYLRSTFIPGEEKCYCLFEGPSADAVKTANDRAQLPYERIVEAMHIASEDLA
jgi:muconolactone delta-isomerase